MITTIHLLIVDTSFFSGGLLFSTLMLSAIALGLCAVLYTAYSRYMLQKQPRPIPYTEQLTVWEKANETQTLQHVTPLQPA